MSPTVRYVLLGLLAVIVVGQGLSWIFRRRAANGSRAPAPMTQYSKLGTLLLRVFGLLMLLYAAPMVLVNIVGALAGGGDGTDTAYQSLSLWLAYGVAGALAYFFAVPLARRAACGIEQTSAGDPQA